MRLRSQPRYLDRLLLCLLLQEFFNCSRRSGKYYLAAEPSVECYDFSSWNQHTTMFPICALGMVFYVLGIPVLFGYLLYRNRKVRALPSSRCSGSFPWQERSFPQESVLSENNFP